MAAVWLWFVLPGLATPLHLSACPPEHVPWPSASSSTVECQPYDLAVKESTEFLKSNLPPWDAINVVTLFGEPGGVDGLNNGIAARAVNLSLDLRMDAKFPWAASVPKDIFQDYVLPYANMNEGRSDVRGMLSSALLPILNGTNATTFQEVTAVVNGYSEAGSTASVWAAVSKSKIFFKSGSTPLIYDPMSVIAFGYASCTGISVLLVDALRSVGVPARVVGTPAWNNVTENGNHNWVEVWMGEKEGWGFIEGKPAGQGETLTDPCNKWFCDKAHFPVPNNTPVFATRFKNSTGVVYPMAWDPENDGVPGVDRTDFYAAACSKC